MSTNLSNPDDFLSELDHEILHVQESIAAVAGSPFLQGHARTVADKVDRLRREREYVTQLALRRKDRRKN